MSRLRARCPDCRALTAVALDDAYECHACGRAFGAGLVRVPRAWGAGGERLAAAAYLELPYPETAVVACGSLDGQTAALASDLPARPLVLGGCCCAHIGAIAGLAARHGRLAVVWFDAHGDLNTPETSPSGNLWGMPLRTVLDGRIVREEDVALVGARSLDPGELEFLARSPLHRGPDAIADAARDAGAAYVAFDADVLEPGELEPFMPQPGGLSLAEACELLRSVRALLPLAGLGFSGLTAAPANAPKLARLAAAAGL